MFNIFKKLLGSKQEEEELIPVRIEQPVIKKSIEEVRKDVYDQIANVLYEDSVFSSHSGYDTYPRLKRSLEKINKIIDGNKESLIRHDSELRILKEKVSDYKEERSLSMVTYDICDLIRRYKHQDPSTIIDAAVGRILYWYGLSY
ncbi:hypothetical protein HYV89_03135 [Candidatus Woesearchaeota archaeon]|nr:hypothetical protein [Candidatus Woesearchaeota archaeon]